MSDWIIEHSDTDFSRRYLTDFIDPFPTDYLELVLGSKYQPDLDQLIDDYLSHNPTRNRSLDLLPLLAEIDETRVLAGVARSERSLVKRRPAFHYRLPDCRIGDPHWSIAGEWNRWWYVESVASDPALLDELASSWRQLRKRVSLGRRSTWVRTVSDTLPGRLGTAELVDG